MKDLLARLTSRTFWVTIGAFITLCASEQYTEAVAVAIAYITGEKYVDSKQSRTTHYSAPGEAVDDEPDVSRIETGVGRIKPHDEED